jgi:8-oxo-dGTP diphosphatase
LSIYVVRHAKAGTRHDWDGDDTERPLTANGRRQADAITARLATERVTGLWSSPYVRCMQTLEPLGRQLGLEVIAEKRLGEGTRFEDVLALLAEVPDGAVLCTHGDILPELIDALVRRGTDVLSEPDWRKGALWILSTPDETGHVATATAEPPPSS